MPAAARVADATTCPLHGAGIIQPPCSLDVTVDGRARARLGDFALCAGGFLDVIVTGSAHVLADGLPVARVDDRTVHGGKITSGSSDVETGGGTFALPANFVLRGDAAFQQIVVRDLYFLTTLRSGHELIRRLHVSGQTVTFVPFSGPNSYCLAVDEAKAHAGQPTGSKVSYNPHLNLQVYDRNGNLVSMPPQIVLGHEMTHALDNATGVKKYGTDPNPPASQPDLEEEEAQAIGTGSHTNDYPTENSYRRDLGLPERDNHYGVFPPPGSPPPPNYRPGGP